MSNYLADYKLINELNNKNMKANLIKWLIFSFVLFVFAGLKHFLLGSSVWDFGIFEQFSWLIANGQINEVSSLRGITPLQDHFSLLLVPIAYIYKILPSGFTLIALQSLALGSLPVLSNILFLKNKTSPKLKLGLFIAISFTPIIFLVNIANFHPEVLSSPFMLLAISKIKRKGNIALLLYLILILSAKKAQVLFGFGLGIYAFLNRRFIKGIAIFSVSSIWWLIASRISSEGGDYLILRLGYLGNSNLDIIFNLITKPWIVFSEAPPSEIFLYSVGLFIPFIFLLGKNSLISFAALIPIYLTNIISSSGSQRELYSQYSISILPFIIVGCWDSIEDKSKWNEESIKIIFNLTLMAVIIGFIGYSRIGYFESRYIPNLSEALEFQKMTYGIEKGFSILTTDKYASRLSNRKLIHSIETNKVNRLNTYDLILLPINPDNNTKEIQKIVKTAKKSGIKCQEQNEFFFTCKK